MNLEEHFGIIYAIMLSIGTTELVIPKNEFNLSKDSPSMIITYDTDREEYRIILKEIK